MECHAQILRCALQLASCETAASDPPRYCAFDADVIVSGPAMNLIIRSLVISALIAPAALVAASFEGKVTFKMTASDGKPQEMLYNIKGDKIRLEMPGQQAMGGMILDTTKKETTVIMDEQKM